MDSRQLHYVTCGYGNLWQSSGKLVAAEKTLCRKYGFRIDLRMNFQIRASHGPKGYDPC